LRLFAEGEKRGGVKPRRVVSISLSERGKEIHLLNPDFARRGMMKKKGSSIPFDLEGEEKKQALITWLTAKNGKKPMLLFFLGEVPPA